jgi:hypothetical protein
MIERSRISNSKVLAFLRQVCLQTAVCIKVLTAEISVRFIWLRQAYLTGYFEKVEKFGGEGFFERLLFFVNALACS